MTAATSRLRRRSIGAGVAALVGLTGLGFAAVPAQAAAGFDPAASQVSGVDRFDTAAQIAVAAFPGGAQTVVVANGDRAIDAQAGAYVAGLNKAPILLTQKSSVPAYTVAAIKKLGATKAIVLGDQNSVDATALAQMAAAGLTVTVVAGDDRFETAADIYNLGTTKASTVFLARADLLAGQVSPDALAASPLAYDGTPVLLTNASSLPQATADAIKNGGVKNVVVLGNAITDSVKAAVTALGATVTTLAGDDRSLTAQKIADYGFSINAYGKTAATIANGDKIDALAAGPWAAINKAPILLTLGTNSLGTGTTNYLTANASTLTKATVFGDANSVPASLTSVAKTVAGGDVTSNKAYAITPSDTVVLPYGVPTSANTRVYTATVPAGTVVDIKLFNAANVTTDANGVASFADADSNNVADLGTVTGASITQVNGVAGATPDNITSGGTVTFSVTSTGAVNVVPVVFADATDDDNLNLTVPTTANANAKTPTDAFGVGGVTVFAAPQAGLGTISDVTLTAADTVNNFFTAGGVSYSYDSNDTFQYGGQPLTLDQFEAAVGVGAHISGSYATSVSGVSTFNITTQATVTQVAAPTVTVVNADGGTTANDVRVAYTRPSGNPAGTTYKLQQSTNAGTSWTDVTATEAATTNGGSGDFTYSLNNVANGSTYTYRVEAIRPVTGVAVDGATSAPATVVPGASDTTRPTAVDTVSTVAAGLSSTLDAGDVFKIVFSEPVAAPAAGSVLQLRDSDGTVVSLTSGTNASFIPNTVAETVNGVSRAAGTVVTVTLTTAPATINPGTATGLQIPATIIDQRGIADLASNAWVPSTTSQDVVVDAVGADTQSNAADTVSDQPVITSGTATPVNTSTIAVSGTAEPGASVTINRGAGSYTNTVTANPSTGVFTFSGVTLAANSTNSISVTARDVAGNPTSTPTTFSVVQDSIAPVLSSVAPGGTAGSYYVTLTYNESLAATIGVPDPASFTVLDSSSSPLTVSATNFPTSTTVRLLVSGDATGGSVAYTPGGNPIRDRALNQAAAFTAQSL